MKLGFGNETKWSGNERKEFGSETKGVGMRRIAWKLNEKPEL